jgi:hypothetical protein
VPVDGGERFCRVLGDRVAAADDLDGARAWIQCAGGSGDDAFARVEQRYFPTDAALGRMGLSADRIGEVKQCCGSPVRR